MRLGILTSHPIQYQAPWFRALAKEVDLHVFFAHRQSAAEQGKAGFGVAFEWDVDLLSGYAHQFLKNVSRQPGIDHFSGCDTPEIANIIRAGRFDAFIVCGWYLKSFCQAVWACWRNRVPVLMRGDSLLGTYRSRLKLLLKYWPYYLLLPRLDAHLYVGQRNKEYLRHYGVPEDRLFFAPHFVDNQFFAAPARAARESGRTRALRAELGIPPDAFVLLFAGKFLRNKRPTDFVRACLRQISLGASPDVHALLVGDGPLRGELETLARPYRAHFHFAGFRNQTELPAFYAAADALVLPSEGPETWGLVVNEAMACGLPAIISGAVGCAPDLIEEGKTGFTFPVGSVEALADRMAQLLTMMRQGHNFAVDVSAKISRYSIEAAVEGTLKAVAELQH